MTISEQIRNKILGSERGTIYFLSDFNYLGNDVQVRNYFVRLERKEILIRLAQGIYLYPKIDKVLGISFPAPEDVAKAIANRDKAQILPTGAYALNALGLSTQVPMNAVFITTGTARTIQIGKRKIIFKKSAPKNFSYKSDLMALIVSALKELGEKNVDANVMGQIKTILKEHPEEFSLEDVSLAPAWIRKIILSMEI